MLNFLDERDQRLREIEGEEKADDGRGIITDKVCSVRSTHPRTIFWEIIDHHLHATHIVFRSNRFKET
jgi:hypothetical protein